MPDFPRFGVFFAASLALILVPGPAVLYIVAQSLSKGRRAGLVSMLGIGAGNCVHALLAALGLAALVASSPFTFATVKYLGAGYLVLLGIRRLLERKEGVLGHSPLAAPGTKVFRDAFVVAATNPKTALFFLAFLPQFARRGPSLASQILLLGFFFVILAMLSDTCYALLAGSLGAWLHRRPGAAKGARFVTATVYISLGLLATLATTNGR